MIKTFKESGRLLEKKNSKKMFKKKKAKKFQENVYI